MDRTIWFEQVKRFDPWFQRKDAHHIVLAFRGYKTADAYDAEAALMQLGGFVLAMNYDEQCGKTFVTVREPRALTLAGA